MKTCLITGATGLIGSHLMAELGEGWEVFSLAHGQRPKVPDDRASWLDIDLSGNWNEDVLPGRVDAVVHLAQSGRYRDFPESAAHIFGVNTASTMRLLDYGRRAGAGVFIYASSGSVYGSGDSAFSEDAPAAPAGEAGFYAETKLCSERLAMSYAPRMNIIILRFFFVYGPGQRETMLMPRLIDAVRSGRPVQLQGRDGMSLNPVFAGDAAKALYRALGHQGSVVVNIAGMETLTMRRICEEIGGAVGREPVFDISDVKPKSLIADITRMSGLFATPEVRFAEGILRTLSGQAGRKR